MELFLYDDARARGFAPFALTRPISELCAGAFVTRHRWAQLCGQHASGAITADHLREFVEFDAPAPAIGLLPRGSLIVNTRCLPTADQPPDADVWVCNGQVGAVRLSEAIDVDRLTDGSVSLETLAAPDATRGWLAGRWVEHVWDYIRDLSAQLADDIPLLAGRFELEPQGDAIRGATILGHHPVYVERGAVVEPYTVIDVSAGPVLVRRSARVQAFTRIVGPCAIGPHSTVVGDRIAGSSIGEQCRIHGELSTSLVLGHTNKAHDGFVGHSYLGRWVNLGAGTITSNLKNTYGPVQLWTPDGWRDTGMTFLGALIGDFARTGIGTRLTTGSVIGAGANLFSTDVAPKVIPPFAWGDAEPFETFALDKFLEVAARQMARRDVPLVPGARAHLAAVHRRANHPTPPDRGLGARSDTDAPRAGPR